MSEAEPSPLSRADALVASSPAEAEQIYKEILASKSGESPASDNLAQSSIEPGLRMMLITHIFLENYHPPSIENDQNTRDQETALNRLGALYKGTE